MINWRPTRALDDSVNLTSMWSSRKDGIAKDNKRSVVHYPPLFVPVAFWSRVGVSRLCCRKQLESDKI